jgi:hypothetical protein
VNDTYMRTMHVGMMDRGFTVYNIPIIFTVEILPRVYRPKLLKCL